MEKKEYIFPDGIMFTLPADNAPEWVKGKLSIQPDKFVAWAKQYESERGWVNLDLKKSKEKQTYYLQLNTWKPSEKMDQEKVLAYREKENLRAKQAVTENIDPAVEASGEGDIRAGDIPF